MARLVEGGKPCEVAVEFVLGRAELVTQCADLIFAGGYRQRWCVASESHRLADLRLVGLPRHVGLFAEDRLGWGG